MDYDKMDIGQKRRLVSQFADSPGWKHWMVPRIQARMDRLAALLLEDIHEEDTKKARIQRRQLQEVLDIPTRAMRSLNAQQPDD